MSDLMAEGEPSAAATGNGRSHYNGVHRTTQGSAPSQPNPVQSGVRTPTDIMRQRRDREARKKAEQEAREREKRELERIKKQQELEQQKLDRLAREERRKQAAGVAGDTTRRPGMTSSSRPPEVPLPQDPGTAGIPQAVHPSSGAHLNPRRAGESSAPEPSARQRPSMGTSHQPRPSQSRAPDTAAQTAPQGGFTSAQAPKAQTGQSSSSASQSQAQQQQSRKPFPHAFERWELLSSHWEGLTSYWIRRLEQNNENLDKDPLSQQMSRQITDLSAAGANLFHAVVELQRLRASSERKFQRWFFDTRAEQERSQEMQAELRRLVEVERQSREEAIATAKQAAADKAKAEELVREMRRELQISRDEARRAWEELGRREQEERDRTFSLRNGEPTVVGGVQVVPMIHAYHGRQASSHRPQTREGPYPGGPGPTSMGGLVHRDPAEHADQYSYDSQVSTPKATEPFTGTSREQPHLHHEPDVAQLGASNSHALVPISTTAAPSSKPASAQAPTRGFYQHDSTALHGQSPSSHGADVPSSEAGASEISEDYEPRMTSHPDFPGRQLSYPRTVSEDSDDYENQEVLEQDDQYDQQYSHGTGPDDMHGGYRPGPVDYTGSGWGPTWESMAPRHRHPTRLSDVIEEDERSRTSPSRASQASRGMP